jgi:excisionase family DNA binding protein
LPHTTLPPSGEAKMTDGTEYLRAAGIARLTGVSIRTARRWIAKRLLASGKVGGARLVAKSELERLLSPMLEGAEEVTEEHDE